MQQNEKQAEPSMEDILASIRKIIAEEPNGMKPLTATAQSPPLSAPAGGAIQPKAASSTPVQDPAAVLPKPVMSSRLSDVVRALAPSAVPVGTTPNPATTATALDDDFDDLVEPALTQKPTKLPAAEMPSGPALRPSWDFVPQSAKPLQSRLPAESTASPEPTLRSPGKLDSTALMPSDRSSTTFSFGPESEPPRPRPATMPAAPPMLAPAASQEPESREPAAKMPESASPSVDLGAFVPGTSGHDNAAVPRPLPLAIAADFRAADTVKAGIAPVIVKRPEPASLIAEANTIAPPATEAGPVTAEIGTGSQPLDAAQTALGAFAASLVAPAAAAVPPLVTATVPRGSLDEQILEMARPMVRDWLDANLPEMVERLLAEESNRRGG